LSKQSFVLAPLLLGVALHGCGGATTAAGPATVSTPPTEISFDRWYVVQSTSGPGLRVGSGVRFRESGFDVASGTLAQPMGGSCTRIAEGIDCEGAGGELHVRRRADGAQVAQQGPIELVLADSTNEQASGWSDEVDRTVRRTTACRATADCCVAIANAFEVECDVESHLGDRTVESCEAGLATLRTELTSSGRVAPSECR